MNIASRHSGNTMVAGRPKCDDEEGMMDMAVICHQLNYLRVENSNMSLLFTLLSGAAVTRATNFVHAAAATARLPGPTPRTPVI